MWTGEPGSTPPPPAAETPYYCIPRGPITRAASGTGQTFGLIRPEVGSRSRRVGFASWRGRVVLGAAIGALAELDTGFS